MKSRCIPVCFLLYFLLCYLLSAFPCPIYPLVVAHVFVTAVYLFLLFYSWYLQIVFRRVSNLSSKVMLVNLIQYRGAVGEFNCKKCVCANSSNLFPDKFFQTWQSFQTLLCLLLTNSIFLNLLFFCRTMKNVKVKKIQILLSRAFHSAAVTLLIHHI